MHITLRAVLHDYFYSKNLKTSSYRRPFTSVATKIGILDSISNFKKRAGHRICCSTSFIAITILKGSVPYSNIS